MFKIIKEASEDLVATNLSSNEAEKVLNSVLGQLSDGIWENSPSMKKYWKYADIVTKNGKLFIKVNRNDPNSGFYKKSDEEVKEFFANKIKQIVKEFMKDWRISKYDYTAECFYLKDVTIQDCYKIMSSLV